MKLLDLINNRLKQAFYIQNRSSERGERGDRSERGEMREGCEDIDEVKSRLTWNDTPNSPMERLILFPRFNIQRRLTPADNAPFIWSMSMLQRQNVDHNKLTSLTSPISLLSLTSPISPNSGCISGATTEQHSPDGDVCVRIRPAMCATIPNEAQLQAIANAMVNPVTYVQGPPGTGKTATAVHIVSNIIEENIKEMNLRRSSRRHTIGIFAASNVAVDNLAIRLIKSLQAAGLIPSHPDGVITERMLNVTRVYSKRYEAALYPWASSTDESRLSTVLNAAETAEFQGAPLKKATVPVELQPFWLAHKSKLKNNQISNLTDRMMKAWKRGDEDGFKIAKRKMDSERRSTEIETILSSHIIIATAYFPIFNKSIFPDGGVSFDTVLIDEAAQVQEVETALLCHLAKKRIVLLGDHMQLAPVILETGLPRPVFRCLGQSLVERLFGGTHRQNNGYRQERNNRLHDGNGRQTVETDNTDYWSVRGPGKTLIRVEERRGDELINKMGIFKEKLRATSIKLADRYQEKVNKQKHRERERDSDRKGAAPHSPHLSDSPEEVEGDVEVVKQRKGDEDRVEYLVTPTLAVAILLRKQYRMLRAISWFPSMMFYGGQLIDLPDTDAIPVPPAFPFPNGAYCPIKWIDIRTTHQKEWVDREDRQSGVLAGQWSASMGVDRQSHSGYSLRNQGEVDACTECYKMLRDSGVNASDIGVVSPYRAQVDALKHHLPQSDMTIIGTIHSIQGMERDYVIVSLVRSYAQVVCDQLRYTGGETRQQDSQDEVERQQHSPHHQQESSEMFSKIEKRTARNAIGFLSDTKMMNVLLTRARKGLIMIGNTEMLRMDPTYDYLLKFYKYMGFIRSECYRL
eukprot:GHVN01074971.1.p1 GENE.GHVN01074971.1~~GHVN01074971.1.p1  ORF type:complete len:859 (-),score=205.27 GHVN01074971.1:122-2698(-)